VYVIHTGTNKNLKRNKAHYLEFRLRPNPIQPVGWPGPTGLGTLSNLVQDTPLTTLTTSSTLSIDGQGVSSSAEVLVVCPAIN
jgi:hypothetical protein